MIIRGIHSILQHLRQYHTHLQWGKGTAKVYEPMLSEGNVDVGYSYAEEDDVKAISQIQAINTIPDALKTMKQNRY